MSELLKTENLTVSTGEVEILHGVSLTLKQGAVHVIMGPNGAGKSTFGYTVMGSPEYKVTNGKILFDGEDITNETADKRAKRGIFLSFQSPVEIGGLTLSNLLRTSLEQIKGEKIRLFDFKKQLKQAMETVGLDPSYADREVNVGFSGGEKKKAEMVQLLMLKPKLAILDETDSGLDVDAVKTISATINKYVSEYGGTALIITHNANILSALDADSTHIIVDGNVAAEGGAELIEEISNNGFEKFIKEETA